MSKREMSQQGGSARGVEGRMEEEGRKAGALMLLQESHCEINIIKLF